jgi:hypothetical protein
VTFRLEAFYGGTELTLTHELTPTHELTLTHEHLADEEARTSQAEGWSSRLDKLPVFLEDCE